MADQRVWQAEATGRTLADTEGYRVQLLDPGEQSTPILEFPIFGDELDALINLLSHLVHLEELDRDADQSGVYFIAPFDSTTVERATEPHSTDPKDT